MAKAKDTKKKVEVKPKKKVEEKKKDGKSKTDIAIAMLMGMKPVDAPKDQTTSKAEQELLKMKPIEYKKK